jgi:hypothetical protein
MAKRDLGDVAATALTRPGVGLALLAALGVYLVLALRTVLSTIAYLVTSSSDPATYLTLVGPASFALAFGPPLPFAIGVFLSFWQLAPVAPQLRMAHVVTRALLAAVVGALATLVLGFLVALVINLSEASGPILAGSDFASIGRSVLDAARSVLPGALSILIDGLVVVPLAALLLWGRLQVHPPKTAPAGALDEV